MKKGLLTIIIVIFYILIFFLINVNAENIYKSNTNIELTIPCSLEGLNNCNASEYNLTIIDPLGTIFLNNDPATKNPSYLSHLITINNNSIIGKYEIYIVNDEGYTATTFYYSTPNGKELIGDNFLIFYYAIFLILVLSIIYIIIINIAKLATFSTTILDIAFSMGLYFGILSFYWIGQTYIPETNFTNLIENLFVSIGMAFILIILPLISLVITIIKKSTDKKNVPSIQEITGRRLFSYG